MSHRLCLGVALAAVAAAGAFAGSGGGAITTSAGTGTKGSLADSGPTASARRSLAGVVAGNLAPGSPGMWQNVAARVSYPVYRPTETLRFALTRVYVQSCGPGTGGWVGARYTKGSGSRAPVFSLTEAFRQFCGNDGESVTAGSVDVDGVKVPLHVYCYNPGPRCTLKDGFTNGFALYLHQPGSKRTLIQISSRYVVVDDFLKVVRSLAGVVPNPQAEPSATSAGGSTVSGDCSKATALRVGKRFFFDPGMTSPVGQVLCGPFTGAGSEAMVVAFSAAVCWPSMQWVIFGRTAGQWRPVLVRSDFIVPPLVVVGADIRETSPVFRPGDLRCFPSGGTHARIWHWNGASFTASEWEQVTPGKAAAPAGAATSGYFKTPSGNIVCGYANTSVYCGIRSGLNPPPPSRGPGCSRSNRVTLAATGRPHTGKSVCPGEDEEDAGPFAGESVARVLDYGTTWSGGGVRCTSAATGLTCRNRSGHVFFLSRERWRVI